MAEGWKSWITTRLRKAAGATGNVAKDAAETAKDAADTISEGYKQSGLKDTVEGAAGWTKDQLDRTGVTATAQSIAETTGQAFDTITGQKILELLEQRISLQDRYNDILATKLEEALRRIAALEEVVFKRSAP